ncbi:Protein of unknown function [Bacillus wiedmannii]|nr:Protein of unknown function [Bacillus wiedmannii]SCN06338.1 Protein of unknown function [Bacillus wiedmannii]
MNIMQSIKVLTQLHHHT